MEIRKQLKEEINYDECQLDSMPISIQFSPTERCNLMCLHCYRKKWGNTLLKNDMDLGLLKLENVRRVTSSCSKAWIVSGGEPFMYNGFRNLVEFLKNNKVDKLFTVSNGTLINEQMQNYLILKQFHFLKISVDGANKETLDYIRGSGVYNKIKKVIKNLNSLKTSFNVKYPIIIITFVIMKINYKEIPDVVKLAKEWGIDKVEFHHCQPDNDDVVDLCMYDMQKECYDYLNKAGEIAKELNIEIEYPDYFGQIEIVEHGKLNNFVRCREPWEFFLIDQIGNVYPCCHLWGEEFGNVYNKSLSEIWNGRNWVNMRREIIENGVAHCCLKSNCPKVLEDKFEKKK